jgi:hypothetical protein
MSAPNIIEAMETVFAKSFKRRWWRGDSWKAWHAFLAAVFAVPMNDEMMSICRKHTGRSDLGSVAGQLFREVFCIVGRRGGKTIVAALIGTYLAVFRDYSEVLGPGEVGIVMLIAADRRQARVLLGYINSLFENVPMLKRLVISRTQESITLTGRICIEVHTASFRTVRGFTIVAVVADEVAFWRSEDSANPDVEILNAIRPAMATIPNALLLSISSPYAKRGVLWDAHRRHYGKSSAPVLVWQADTRSMNPTVPQKEIDRAREQDPAAARAEYDAQFRDDIAAFIDREVVERRVVSGRLELAPMPDTSYIAFVDPSGGSSDSMTLAIAHKRKDVAVLDLVREVVPPFSPESVVSEFVGTLKSYRIHTVTGDAYSAEWVREQFRKRGIEYRISDRNRSEIYLNLLPILNSGGCELLDHAKLVTQLSSLERRTARSGNDSIDHSPGSHDDLANAAAGALVGAVGGGVELTFAKIQVEHFDKYGVAWPERGKEDVTVPEVSTPAGPPSENASVVKVRAAQSLGVTCPRCGSSCVVRRQSLYHCNADGFEFPVPDAAGEPPKGQRRETLENMPQERKWRGR